MPTDVIDGTTVKVPLKAFATFERGVQPKQYEKTNASVMIQADITEDADREAVAAAIQAAFADAKAIVYDELGIEFHADEQGVMREVRTERTEREAAKALTEAFGGTEARPAGAVLHERYPDKPADGYPTNPGRDWLMARWETHPEEFYDNRPKKASGEYKPNAPDLKHKATNKGVWFTPRPSGR